MRRVNTRVFRSVSDGVGANPLNLARREFRRSKAPEVLPGKTQPTSEPKPSLAEDKIRRLVRGISQMRWSMLNELPKVPPGGLASLSEEERLNWVVNSSRQLSLIFHQWFIAMGRPAGDFEKFQEGLQAQLDAQILHSYWGPVSAEIHIPTVDELIDSDTKLSEFLLADFLAINPEAEQKAAEREYSFGQGIADYMMLDAQAEDALRMREREEGAFQSILAMYGKDFEEWMKSMPESVVKSSGFSGSEDEQQQQDSQPTAMPVGVKIGLAEIPFAIDGGMAAIVWKLVKILGPCLARQSTDPRRSSWSDPGFQKWLREGIYLPRRKELDIDEYFDTAETEGFLDFRGKDRTIVAMTVKNLFVKLNEMKNGRETSAKTWDEFMVLFADFVEMWAFRYPHQDDIPKLEVPMNDFILRATEGKALSSSSSRAPKRMASPTRRSAADAAASSSEDKKELVRYAVREMKTIRAQDSEMIPAEIEPSWPVTYSEASNTMFTVVKDGFNMLRLLGRQDAEGTVADQSNRVYMKQLLKHGAMKAAIGAISVGVAYYAWSRLPFWTVTAGESIFKKQADHTEGLVDALVRYGGDETVQKLNELQKSGGMVTMHGLYSDVSAMSKIVGSMDEYTDGVKAVEEMNTKIPGLVKMLTKSASQLKEGFEKLGKDHPGYDNFKAAIQSIQEVADMAKDVTDLQELALRKLKSFPERMAALRNAMDTVVFQTKTAYSKTLMDKLDDVLANTVRNGEIRAMLQEKVASAVDVLVRSVEVQKSPIDLIVEGVAGNGVLASGIKKYGHGWLMRYFSPLHTAQVRRYHEQLDSVQNTLEAVSTSLPRAEQLRDGSWNYWSARAISSKYIVGANITLVIDGVEQLQTIRVSQTEMNFGIPSQERSTSTGIFYNALFYTYSKIAGAVSNMVNDFQATNNVTATDIALKGEYIYESSEVYVTDQISAIVGARSLLESRAFQQTKSVLQSERLVKAVSSANYRPVMSYQMFYFILAQLQFNKFRALIYSISSIFQSEAVSAMFGFTSAFEVEHKRNMSRLAESNQILRELSRLDHENVLREPDALDELLVEYIAKLSPAAKRHVTNRVFPGFSQENAALRQKQHDLSDPIWRITKAMELQQSKNEAAENNTLSTMSKFTKTINKGLLNLLGAVGATYADLFRAMSIIGTVGVATYSIYSMMTTLSPDFAYVSREAETLIELARPFDDFFKAAALGTSFALAVPAMDYAMAKTAAFSTFRSSTTDLCLSDQAPYLRQGLRNALALPESGPWGSIRFILARLDAAYRSNRATGAMLMGLTLMNNHPMIAASSLIAMGVMSVATLITEIGSYLRAIGKYEKFIENAIAAKDDGSARAARNMRGRAASGVATWTVSAAFEVAGAVGNIGVGTGLLGKLFSGIIYAAPAVAAFGASTLSTALVERWTNFIYINSFLRITGCSMALTISLGSMVHSVVEFWRKLAVRRVRTQQLEEWKIIRKFDDDAQAAILTVQETLDSRSRQLYEAAVFNSYTPDYRWAGFVQLIWTIMPQVVSLVIAGYLFFVFTPNTQGQMTVSIQVRAPPSITCKEEDVDRDGTRFASPESPATD